METKDHSIVLTIPQFQALGNTLLQTKAAAEVALRELEVLARICPQLNKPEQEKKDADASK